MCALFLTFMHHSVFLLPQRKLEIEGVKINVIRLYSRQEECDIEDDIGSGMCDVVDIVPRGKKVVNGANFRELIGARNKSDEEVIDG